MGGSSETVHGPSKMWLVVFADGEPERYVEVANPAFTIGRDESCDLVLDDPRVSRRHAYLGPAPGSGRLLHDLGSNETLVNGRPIPLTPGFTAGAERVVEIQGDEWLQFGDSAVLATRKDPTQAIEEHRTGSPREGTDPTGTPQA